MNFLLHRHFAVLELDSKAAGVGAMLPDLWRMADRRMRARAVDDEAPLDTGVTHHLEADAWFHRTETFKTGERQLARQLATVGAPKLVLFAHAAWEMCLDGALLQGESFDDALDELRGDIDHAAHGFDAVATRHGADRLDDRTSFDQRMKRLREGLVEGRWIGSYRTGDGLVRCIAGMRRRFALPALEPEEESIAACMLEEALDRAKEALPRLRQARRAHLLEAAS